MKSLRERFGTSKDSLVLRSEAWFCGIERDRVSPSYGDIVCPVINLWTMQRDGRLYKKGTLHHGSHVRVLKIRKVQDGRTFYKVMGAGKTGWVAAGFICYRDPRDLRMEDLENAELFG